MKHCWLACLIFLWYGAWAQAPAPAPSPTPSPSPSLEATVAGELADTAVQTALKIGVKNSPFASTIDQTAVIGSLATLRMGANRSQSDVNSQTYQTILLLMEHNQGVQVGSTPDTKGTTSLAMKGTVPKILGFAVQHGAITQQVNGNTVTFRATPAGVLKSLAGVDIKSILGVPTNASGQPVPTTCDWCNKFSAAISFDVSQGANPGTLTAAKQQVQSWSLRSELVNHRDPTQRRYIRNFQHLTGEFEYMRRHEELANAFAQGPGFSDWISKLADQVTKEVDEPLANGSLSLADAKLKFISIVTPALQAEQKLQFSADFDNKLKSYADAIKPLLEQRNAIVDLANKGLLITADWTVTRDPNVPDLSTITGILENGLGPGRKYDLTVNVAAAFFNSTPKAPVHQFHDFKATAQYDIPLGTFQSYGPFVFSLASRYEFLPNDTLSPGGTITGTATTPTTAAPSGNMWVGQAKLTIPVKGTGVKIPFSISAANRTELIKEKDVRGNIGITFDLDAIFAQVGANSAK
jgi:hypothetical protein